MRLSGRTVEWHGTPHLDDWVVCIVNGTKSRKLILTDHAPERKAKSLLTRIQGLTKELGGDILVSGTTHARLGGRVPLVRAAAAHVKGRTAEVEVYRLA